MMYRWKYSAGNYIRSSERLEKNTIYIDYDFYISEMHSHSAGRKNMIPLRCSTVSKLSDQIILPTIRCLVIH